MFSLEQWRQCDEHYQSTMLYKRRLEVMMKKG
jgi:hypothetical protein